MSPITITALIIFAVTYILMLTFQKIRPHITVTSTIIFVVLGVITTVNPHLFGEGFFAIGTSANIEGIGILRKEVYEVNGTTFMKFGVQFTMAAVITGYLLLWIIWG